MKRRRLLLVTVPILAIGAALFWPRDDPERDIAAALAGFEVRSIEGEPLLADHARAGIRYYNLRTNDPVPTIARARRHLAPPEWRETPLFNSGATFDRGETSLFARIVHTTPGLRVLGPLFPLRRTTLRFSLANGGVEVTAYRASDVDRTIPTLGSVSPP